METHNNPGLGNFFSILSMISAFLTWISIKDVQAIVTLIGGGIAIVSGILGGILFWLSIKEKRAILKNLKNKQ